VTAPTVYRLSDVPEVNAMPWVHDDGGRADAGYRGQTGDCACRAIAIATGMPYQEVYDLIIDAARRERPHARRTRSHPRTGVHKETLRRIMADLGWTWTPTMSIGSGTTVHLRTGEIPDHGHLLVAVSKHYVAVIHGVVHDNHDPSREGTRAVYGWYTPPGASALDSTRR
jgi:hypothetical protein